MTNTTLLTQKINVLSSLHISYCYNLTKQTTIGASLNHESVMSESLSITWVIEIFSMRKVSLNGGDNA